MKIKTYINKNQLISYCYLNFEINFKIITFVILPLGFDPLLSLTSNPRVIR